MSGRLFITEENISMTLRQPATPTHVVLDVSNISGIGDMSVNRGPNEVRAITRMGSGCGGVPQKIPVTQQKIFRMQRGGDNPHIFTARVRPVDKKVEVGWVSTPNQWWKIEE